MRVLAFDTSTLTASVAVVDGEPSAALSRVSMRAARDSDTTTHSDNLLPLIDAVLAEAGTALADLDAIAIGAGPGSFTGLRIGMATAKGLAFATGKPLWAVSSLTALAAELAADNPITSTVIAVLDARREEVFAGCYALDESATLRRLNDERVMPPEELGTVVAALAGGGPIRLVGDGIVTYPDELSSIGTLETSIRVTPAALRIAELALTDRHRVDVTDTGAPVYIRPSEAELRFPNGNPGGTFSVKK
jgi:tRNA threonylcarbamoyladenosine biosynthesis protein TsaB